MAICGMCPAGENDVPAEIIAEHIQLIHPDKVAVFEMTGEDARSMMASLSAGQPEHCSHALDGVSRAYWRLREELSAWRSTDLYRRLKNAAQRGEDGAGEAFMKYKAFGDGLEAAAEVVHDVGTKISREME